MEGGVTVSSKLLLTGLLCLPLLSTAVLADSHKSEKPCRYPVNENLGWEFYRANEFSQALTVFQNTLSITPKDISALRGQAYSLYKLKQYNLALLKLPEVIALEASHKLPVFKDITQYGQKVHYNAQTLLAWCHYALGKPALAKTLFNQTLDLHPHWADAYTGLGYTAISLNRRSAAESSFKRALQATPHYQPAERGLREAKRLLQVTEMRIGDIASSLGFDDFAYFCAVFKKFHAMTPLQCRKNAISRQTKNSTRN